MRDDNSIYPELYKGTEGRKKIDDSNAEYYKSQLEDKSADYKPKNMLNIHDIIGHEIALVGFRYHCDDDWQE